MNYALCASLTVYGTNVLYVFDDIYELVLSTFFMLYVLYVFYAFYVLYVFNVSFVFYVLYAFCARDVFFVSDA